MAGSRTSILCERCAAVTPIERDSAETRYCASCKLFICGRCWNGEQFSCAACAEEASDDGSDPQASLNRAINAFRDLAKVRTELESLGAVPAWGSATELELQHRLLIIKADDTTSAAISALSNAPQEESTHLIRHSVEVERLRVAALPSAPPTRRSSRPRLPAITVPHVWPFAAAAIGIATVIGGAALIPAVRPDPTERRLGAMSSPSVEGGVAGARSSPVPPSPGATATPPSRETFDELFIGAQLPERWSVMGRAESVQVAPFPNPVDRSLRVTSSPDGASNAACYQIGIATSISLDVFSDRPPGMLISLRSPESGSELGLLVGVDGSILTQPANTRLGDSVVDPDEWHRVFLGIDTAKTVTLKVEPRDAIGVIGAQASVPFEWPSTDAHQELCVASPGTAGDAAFVDNVIVR